MTLYLGGWFVFAGALAEAVDLYPTLADLAGLPDPTTAFPGSGTSTFHPRFCSQSGSSHELLFWIRFFNPPLVAAGINGSSLLAAFVDPAATGKQAAFSQFAKTAGFETQALHPSCWGPAGTYPGPRCRKISRLYL